MKFPKTAEDVETEILSASDNAIEHGPLRLRQLINILRNVDSEIVVDGVLMVLSNTSRPETYIQDQEFAGEILKSIQPHSSKDPDEILLIVLSNWDKSIEQFPLWLAANYGIDMLKTSLNKISLINIEKDKLATIKWWLQME